MILLLCALLSPVPAIERDHDPITIERRVGQIQLEFDRLVQARDWPAALSSIRQVASIDPDHPRAYLMVVQLQARRGAREEAGGIMDGLGAPDGPGRLYGEGVSLFMGGKHEAAAGAFTRALDLYREKDHAAGQAACHTALGNVDRQANRLDQARAHYEAAGPLLARIEDHLGRADTLSNLAKLERQAGRPLQAADRQREVLALREELGDVAGQSRSWHEIGVSLLQASDHQGALAALDRALTMRRAAGDRAAEATTRQVQGEAHLAAGDDRKALESFEAAASIFTAVRDAQSAAGTGSWIGRTLRRLGEFIKAREILEAVLTDAVGLKDERLQAAILTELAAVHAALWDVADALVTGQRALELNRSQANRRGELINLNTLCGVHYGLGETERARHAAATALQIADDLGDGPARARAYNNLGVLLAQAGDLAAGLDRLRQAEKTWDPNRDPRGAATSQANIAEILVAQNRLPEAEQRLRAALEAFRASGDRLGQASTSNQMATLRLHSGRTREANLMFQEALALAERSGFAEEEWRARAGLASALEAMGRRNEAIGQALRALDRVESVRARLPSDTFKMRFLAGRMDLPELALSLLLGKSQRIEGARAAEALRVVERARARALVDLLAESGARLRDAAPAELRSREERALDRYSAATVRLLAGGASGGASPHRSDLDQAEEDLRRIEIEIRTAVPRYAGMVYPSPAAPAAIQAALGDDEVLLEYFTGTRGAWVWQVTRAGVSVRSLPPPVEIEKAVTAFLEWAGSPGSALTVSRSDAAAGRLAAMLAPASRHLSGKRLLIVPDGRLHHVPFDALSREGRFLVEDHEIVVVPSATALLMMRAQGPSPAPISFLGVGDPVPGEGLVGALPFSRSEVERLAGHFEESSRTVLTGASVSRTALKRLDLERFRFVHFATHGLLKAGEGQVGLWLGAATPDRSDSVLTIQDLLTLRLGAEVVVLSACQSGLGELIDGEGLVSLTRALIYAGSRSVVVALWNVNDESTLDFMETFYAGLRSGESPASALRDAKLSFIRSDRLARRQPYRWAPFVLVGAPHR